MKNLKMYGVETLNTQEMRETDGGFWRAIARKVGEAIMLDVALEAAEGIVNEIIEDVKVGWNNPK